MPPIQPPPTLVPTPPAPLLLGLDVLLRDGSDVLAGKRVGFVTNQTGRDRQGRSSIDLLHGHTDWQLVALFSPEHGIRGDVEAGDQVSSSVDRRTGLPVHSLYGDTKRPTPAMLSGVDVLVYDIQDVGARVYTYPATLLEVMRAGAAHGRPVVVLDRPNPIGGAHVEGNVLDVRFTSFVGPAPVSMRYGMTIGELGRLMNAELNVGANLHVVPLQGWRREQWWDQTGLPWVNPSPNLRSLSAATIYPGTVLFEGTNLSEGRGTERPFEWVGAPWVDDTAWAERLNAAAALPGVRFRAQRFTPTASKHRGQDSRGVLVEVTNREQVRPMELGVALVAAVQALHPRAFQFLDATFDGLAGTDRVRLAIARGQPAAEIAAAWGPDLQRFLETRSRYLLY